MLDLIRNFFDANLVSGPDTVGQAQIDRAAAALLIEVMRADDRQTEQELTAIAGILRDELSVEEATIAELIELAREEVAEATSLYQFTHLIHQHYDQQQKFQLLVSLWRVAYADGSVDKYEDGIIRRIAELIYLPHREFIRAKHVARSYQS